MRRILALLMLAVLGVFVAVAALGGRADNKWVPIYAGGDLAADSEGAVDTASSALITTGWVPIYGASSVYFHIFWDPDSVVPAYPNAKYNIDTLGNVDCIVAWDTTETIESWQAINAEDANTGGPYLLQFMGDQTVIGSPQGWLMKLMPRGDQNALSSNSLSSEEIAMRFARLRFGIVGATPEYYVSLDTTGQGAQVFADSVAFVLPEWHVAANVIYGRQQ